MQRYTSMRKLAAGGPNPPGTFADAYGYKGYLTKRLNQSNSGLGPFAATPSTGEMEPVTVMSRPRPKRVDTSIGLAGIGKVKSRGPLELTSPAAASSGTGEKSDRFGRIVSDIQPFVTNIANAFRKPPMPKKPLSNPFVTLNRVNLQNERNAVSRGTTAANRATERNVDANTAEAIKQFNRGTEFDRMSAINERELNANTEIGNREALVNSQIGQQNNAAIDDYNQMLVEREVAHQREQSANWANAGDKLGAIRNEKEKGRVELEKAKVLSGMFSKSGVLDRYSAELEKMGIKNPLKAYGGYLGRMRKLN